jgi:hypothetical protein
MPVAERKQLRKISVFVVGVVLGFGTTSFLVLQPPQIIAEDSQWIRPAKPGDPLLWGRKGGIIFGLPSEGGLPGPRGLIRLGVISDKTGLPELLNFIAIEPAVAGRRSRGDRMAFSELEPSRMDPGLQGKRLWVGPDGSSAQLSGTLSGTLSVTSSILPDGPKSIERLTVRIEVERFQANGAHVYLLASIDSDHPDEVRIAVYRYEDSPKIEELTLTATMGNYERLRWLWLKDRVIDSRELYRSYHGDDFAEHGAYPLRKMLRDSDGDPIVFCTTNEANPQLNPDFTAKDHWRYRLGRLTQYWRVPASDIQPNLRVRVNGRRVYWSSHAPLGGGIAFENFEVRQVYKPGQTFVFGVTRKEPWEIQPAIPHLAHARNPEVN